MVKKDAMNQTLKDKKENILKSVEEVLHLEADAVKSMAKSVGDSFYEAVSLLLSAKGKTVLTGVGKSGLIARKIAATMSSRIPLWPEKPMSFCMRPLRKRLVP